MPPRPAAQFFLVVRTHPGAPSRLEMLRVASKRVGCFRAIYRFSINKNLTMIIFQCASAFPALDLLDGTAAVLQCLYRHGDPA